MFQLKTFQHPALVEYGSARNLSQNKKTRFLHVVLTKRNVEDSSKVLENTSYVYFALLMEEIIGV